MVYGMSHKLDNGHMRRDFRPRERGRLVGLIVQKTFYSDRIRMASSLCGYADGLSGHWLTRKFFRIHHNASWRRHKKRWYTNLL